MGTAAQAATSAATTSASRCTSASPLTGSSAADRLAWKTQTSFIQGLVDRRRRVLLASADGSHSSMEGDLLFLSLVSRSLTIHQLLECSRVFSFIFRTVL